MTDAEYKDLINWQWHQEVIRIKNGFNEDPLLNGKLFIETIEESKYIEYEISVMKCLLHEIRERYNGMV